MMEEYQSPTSGRAGFLEVLRTATGFGLVLLALFCIVIAGLWFVNDFFAASVYSPNLDPDAQLADFNDFAYLSSALLGYRFSFGLLILLSSITAIMLALLVLRNEGKSKPIFIVGGILVLLGVLILIQAFYWPVFLQLILGFVALYLATEWSRLLPDTDTTDADADTATADVETHDHVAEEVLVEEAEEKIEAQEKVTEAPEALVEEVQEPEHENTETAADTDIPEDTAEFNEIPELSEQVSDEDVVTEEKVQAVIDESEIDDGSEVTLEDKFDLSDVLLDEESLESHDNKEAIVEQVKMEETSPGTEQLPEQEELGYVPEIDPDETDTNIDIRGDYLKVEHFPDTEEIESDNLVPIINDRVDAGEQNIPDYETDTAFVTEAELLEGKAAALPESKPGIKVKSDVAEKQTSRKDARRHKKRRGGWRSWTLIDWSILSMIVLLALGIVVLLVAG